MAASKVEGMCSESDNKPTESYSDRLKKLYPAVDETETPLPKQWSPKDKFSYLGLSQNNLRVHYKGSGKNHKDAASVRAAHPIPASCGIYYFEVKVISKGRDGYMGIGLSVHGVNLNRLPGWDKMSYGYHGDDGHSFCSSGTGSDYGPTFTTGDIIGCCVNLVDGTCFYTKNGVNLGIAFRDLPPDLYPTVGLQTPGEIIEANFGQQPFVFDIEDYIEEWRRKTTAVVHNFPVPLSDGEWHSLLQRMVSTYLVHYGYCATAEVFSKLTGQNMEENIGSIKNRQRIQQKILAGHIGEAIDLTQNLYPGLLPQNPSLLFLLKCRQFIEMIGGNDMSYLRPPCRSPKSQGSGSGWGSPSSSPNQGGPRGDSAHIIPTSTHPQPKSPQSGSSSSDLHQPPISDVQHLNSVNASLNGSTPSQSIANGSSYDDETVMETDAADLHGNVSNGSGDGPSGTNICSNGSSTLTASGYSSQDEIMDTSESCRRQILGGNQLGLEKLLQFGRELNAMAEQLKSDDSLHADSIKKSLRDAFSLLAYSDPWSSPMGYQLDPVQREVVFAALNSAILESQGLQKQAPLEMCVGQVSQCIQHMVRSGIGASAFANLSDYV